MAPRVAGSICGCGEEPALDEADTVEGRVEAT